MSLFQQWTGLDWNAGNGLFNLYTSLELIDITSQEYMVGKQILDSASCQQGLCNPMHFPYSDPQILDQQAALC